MTKNVGPVSTIRVSSLGAGPKTVGAVLSDIFRHPVERVLLQWNWKSAVTSSAVRAAIFFFVNLWAGWRAAVGAMLAELAFRSVFSGVCGALTEAFRDASPRWAATLTVMVFLPVVNHSLEFLLHWLRHTPVLKASILASVAFTAVSSAFNLHAMREGALVVGREGQSLGSDLKRMPKLLLTFFGSPVIAIYALVSKFVGRGKKSAVPASRQKGGEPPPAAHLSATDLDAES